MTEKPFKVTNISQNGMTGLFWQGKTNLSVYDVVRLINELYEENEQLNSENIALSVENKELKCAIIDLNNKNNHLKSEINMLKNTIGRNESYIARLTGGGAYSTSSTK